MPHRTFVSFIWPSALAMILFIAMPIVSVTVQSLFIAHEQVIETVQNCGPFGCKDVEVVNAEATAQLRAEEPWGDSTASEPTPTEIIWRSRKSALPGMGLTGLAILPTVF